jgi:hypothetical protein
MVAIPAFQRGLPGNHLAVSHAPAVATPEDVSIAPTSAQ